jgi:hypothetical protein
MGRLRSSRKQSWPNLRYCPGIGHKVLRKITKYLSQNSWSPGRDLNPGPLEYETGVLTTRRSTEFPISSTRLLGALNTVELLDRYSRKSSLAKYNCKVSSVGLLAVPFIVRIHTISGITFLCIITWTVYFSNLIVPSEFWMADFINNAQHMPHQSTYSLSDNTHKIHR